MVGCPCGPCAADAGEFPCECCCCNCSRWLLCFSAICLRVAAAGDIAGAPGAPWLAPGLAPDPDAVFCGVAADGEAQGGTPEALELEPGPQGVPGPDEGGTTGPVFPFMLTSKEDVFPTVTVAEEGNRRTG